MLSLVVAMLGYKFTVGEVEPSDDGRMAVMLTKDERNALLLEMCQPQIEMSAFAQSRNVLFHV